MAVGRRVLLGATAGVVLHRRAGESAAACRSRSSMRRPASRSSSSLRLARDTTAEGVA